MPHGAGSEVERRSQMAEDKRTLRDLAIEALLVQDACNLSGVVHGFSRAIQRLRELLPDAGTTEINQHPISQIWADKIASLTRTQLNNSWAPAAYSYAETLRAAKEESFG